MARVARAARASLSVACLALLGSPALGPPVVGPSPLAAQERDDPPVEPEMARAPRLFRVSVTGGALLWGEESDAPTIDDGGAFGLDLESRVSRFLAFRLGAAYGRSSAAASGEEPTDAGQYLVDVVAVGRLGVRTIEAARVVPFGTLGVGAVVHDPERDDLSTKSQSALAFGAGVDVEFATAFGARAEWRHYVVNAESVFEPESRTGNERGADRLFASLYWKL